MAPIVIYEGSCAVAIQNQNEEAPTEARLYFQDSHNNIVECISKKDAAQPNLPGMDNWQPGNVITTSTTPMAGSPLAVVAGKNFAEINIFYVDKDFVIQRLLWTPGTLWNHKVVGVSRSPLTVQKDTDIAAVITSQSESRYPINLYYVPAGGNGQIQEERLRYQPGSNTGNWTSGTMLDEQPAINSRISAVYWFDAFDNIRVYYQTRDFKFREYGFVDDPNSTWKPRSLEIGSTQVMSAIVATFVPHTTPSDGWLRIFAVDLHNNVVQFSNKSDNTWVGPANIGGSSGPAVTAIADSQLGVLSWKGPEFRVYFQDGTQGSKFRYYSTTGAATFSKRTALPPDS
jgi:hypothetical protein